MKLFVIICILCIEISAEMITGIGTAKPNYDNLSDAKESAEIDAIKKYQIKNYSKYGECLKDEFTIAEDKYDTLLIQENNVKITPQNIIIEATFDVREKYNLDKHFEEQCQEKLSRDKATASMKKTLSHFHMGVGLMGWSGTYGGEVFFGYAKNNFALYGAYSNQRLLAILKEETEEEINLGNSQNIAIEGTLFWQNIGFLIGYEHVLKYKNSFDSTNASSAVVWGLSTKPNGSKLNIALIFKEYNDKNDVRENSLSGGVRVRYNFF
jgi:hypothetical protein